MHTERNAGQLAVRQVFGDQPSPSGKQLLQIRPGRKLSGQGESGVVRFRLYLLGALDRHRDYTDAESIASRFVTY